MHVSVAGDREGRLHSNKSYAGTYFCDRAPDN